LHFYVSWRERFTKLLTANQEILNELSNHNINENDLISGCVAGDRRVQELLYQRFAPKMYAVCLRYANNTDDAQDLLQEGFIKVYRNLEKFRKEGSFEGWVRRVFVNTAIEHYRRKVTLNTIGEKEERMIEDSAWNVLDHLAERDIIQLVQELSPGYRSVFNMYVIEGYSHKEIGDILDISEGTSKSQLARAKAILQKRVQEFLDSKRKSITRS
jgi:RNA polymerase sigma factor (sigma-70 family)